MPYASIRLARWRLVAVAGCSFLIQFVSYSSTLLTVTDATGFALFSRAVGILCLLSYLCKNCAIFFRFNFLEFYPNLIYKETANMEGTYELKSSENFDEYMKAIGVGFALRKTAGALKPDIEIKKSGDKWTLKTISTFKTTELEFELGKEIQEKTGDGRDMKTTFTVDGNKLIQSQKATVDKGVDSTITRTFDDTGFTAVCEAAGVKAERRYAKK